MTFGAEVFVLLATAWHAIFGSASCLTGLEWRAVLPLLLDKSDVT